MRRFCVVVVFLLAVVGCSRKQLAPVHSQETSASRAEHVSPAASVFSPQNMPSAQGGRSRPVYPFSLVPGGVYSTQELERALKVSKELRSHYSDLDLSRVQLIRLRADTPAYVSYRHNNQIFWTRHKLLLHSGELVLTDGHYSVRARCANQISMVPREPVEVSPEKVENEMDSPVMQPALDYAKLEPLNSALFPAIGTIPTAPTPGIPVAGVPPTGVVVTGSAPPPMVPPVPITPVCTTCGTPGTTPPPNQPPPVSVPEPGSAELAALSLALVAGLLFVHERRRRTHKAKGSQET